VVLAQLAPRIEFLKEEVYDICAALALSEAVLRRDGLETEAVHIAAVFDVVEGRLAQPCAASSLS